MAREMLSGPDLGGGYLHQLSIDREGEVTTFTYHAQEGGADAGGPAKGPLDVLGFAHPDNPCQFGGPRCWHRRFLLPFAETAKVRMAYNRFRFVLEAMMNQAYSGGAVAVEAALAEFVRRVGPPLAAEGVDWYVGGSTAALLLGARLAPRDLDVGTTRPGVDRIAELLPEYLIEPVGPTDWPSSGIVRGARAFVGTFREGARVEWSVPIEPGTSDPSSEWTGRPGEVRTLEVTVGGMPVRVTRPEYGLVRAAVKGDSRRTDVLVELVRKVGPDLELLRQIVERSGLDPAHRERVLRSVAV
ncbi:MAG: hypothetical protein L3K10_08530 [Thermoplasmata archaeon]|nr:hypothetical protein [Thermoplasmata archaeon]